MFRVWHKQWHQAATNVKHLKPQCFASGINNDIRPQQMLNTSNLYCSNFRTVTGILLRVRTFQIFTVNKPKQLEQHHDKTNKMTFAPREDSVWSEPSLCAQWVAKDPSFLHADIEDWSDWVDGQADLSLRWWHMPVCWFCHEAANLLVNVYD